MSTCIAVAYKDINSDSTFDLHKGTSDSVDLISKYFIEKNDYSITFVIFYMKENRDIHGCSVLLM